MRVLVVTPAPPGAHNGNRVTALRWTAMLRALGCRVTLAQSFLDGDFDLLVALHAIKSADAIARFRAAHPRRPVIVGIAGTDAYGDFSTEMERALDGAWRIVALQPRAELALPPRFRARVRTILQSARAAAPADSSTGNGVFRAIALAHLRAVKDPLTAARAAQSLPPSSRVRIDHFGAALSDQAADEARSSTGARWIWRGALPRRDALAELAASDLLVVTSRSEGGCNAASEAIAAGVPIVATRIDGLVGLLGEDHPGYFPVGDAGALAALLARCESDRAFYETLRARAAQLRPLVDPAREREAWRALLDELSPARRLTTVDAGEPPDDFARDVADGLSRSPRRLACRWFYDPDGSRLFERICELPEYYLPRAEREILDRHADEIVARLPPGAALVELGSGNAQKTRLLLDALLRRQPTVRYLPIDISRAALADSAGALLADYPTLELVAVAGEYGPGLAALDGRADGPKLVAWLGSNIGNFDRAEAAAFLRGLAPRIGDGKLLVGVDLRKAREVLEPAYDDARGVTAEFNRNLLRRINRELGGDFPIDEWRHRAVWDERAGRIDMYLVSPRAHAVVLQKIERSFNFAAGEAVHTESSYKYSPDEIEALAAAAGYTVEQTWLDSERRFAEVLMSARAGGGRTAGSRGS